VLNTNASICHALSCCSDNKCDPCWQNESECAQANYKLVSKNKWAIYILVKVGLFKKRTKKCLFFTLSPCLVIPNVLNSNYTSKSIFIYKFSERNTFTWSMKNALILCSLLNNWRFLSASQHKFGIVLKHSIPTLWIFSENYQWHES